MLQLLPNFFPSEVRALISDFKIEESTGLSFFYTFDAFTYLSQLGVRPGTSSTDIDHPYEWPINWDLNGFLNILEPRSFLAPLSSTHSALLTLLLDLGSHFTRALITALLAPDIFLASSSLPSLACKLATPRSASKAFSAQAKHTAHHSSLLFFHPFLT